MIVLTLQVDVAEFMCYKKLTIKVNKGAMFIALHLAGNFLTLLDSHDFTAVFAVENGIISNLKSPFWRAETEELLFNPGTVQIRQELIPTIFQFFKLCISNTISNMRDYFWVQVAKTNFAAINNWWEHFLEELLPDLFINPFDLEEMACYQLIEAILVSDLEEFFINSEFLFSWGHFF